MNVPSNIGKSTLLAMFIFWTIIFTRDFDLDFMPFILLSIIPIGICVTVIIMATICPVFWIFKRKNESNASLAKRCFPYHIIITFSLCVFGVLASRSNLYFISFLVSAFITTAQSWVWFAKEKNA